MIWKLAKPFWLMKVRREKYLTFLQRWDRACRTAWGILLTEKASEDNLRKFEKNHKQLMQVCENYLNKTHEQ